MKDQANSTDTHLIWALKISTETHKWRLIIGVIVCTLFLLAMICCGIIAADFAPGKAEGRAPFPRARLVGIIMLAALMAGILVAFFAPPAMVVVLGLVYAVAVPIISLIGTVSSSTITEATRKARVRNIRTYAIVGSAAFGVAFFGYACALARETYTVRSAQI
jgi:hypothetical protein